MKHWWAVAGLLLCRLLASIIVIAGMTRSGLGQECRVTTTVRLLDEHQQAVQNVVADQLKAEVGGNPAKIIALSPNAKPGLILLLDASSSVKGTWNQSIAAAKQLASRAGDDIAIIVFRDRIRGYATGRADVEKLLDQLSSQTPSAGGTALYDALIEVAGQLSNRNVAMIVISDGEDNSSSHSSDATVSLFLRSSWPPVFGLILDYGHEQTRRGYFKKIAAATGGYAVYPSSGSKVPAAVNDLAATVFAPFTVMLRPSRPISKPAKLKVEVIGADNKPRHDIRSVHAAEIAGCDAPLPPSAK
jgi:hypothetical protein